VIRGALQGAAATRAGNRDRAGPSDAEEPVSVPIGSPMCADLVRVDGEDSALAPDEKHIGAVFLDGTHDQAFMFAVRANLRHGLPLTRGDRSAAAHRILDSHPNRFDYAPASAVGVSGKTVAALCECSGAANLRPTTRVGCYGRVRSLCATKGHAKAARLLTGYPDTPRWELIRNAVISATSAKDVSDRVIALPARCVAAVVSVAHQYAEIWHWFAVRIDCRAHEAARMRVP
jgi:hypothetical protein